MNTKQVKAMVKISCTNCMHGMVPLYQIVKRIKMDGTVKGSNTFRYGNEGGFKCGYI